MSKSPYKYKGPLNPALDSRNDICMPRSEEVNTVIEGIAGGDYWALQGPKQMGKTTFLRLLQNQLPDDYPVYFYPPVSLSDENNFYLWIIDTLLKRIPHNRKPKISKNYKPELKFLDFLNKFNPENAAGKIILLFDEIDELPFLKEFLFLWRRIYHERYYEKALNKYIIIITGSVNFIELTIGNTSPFNVAETLYLEDFSQNEAETLIMEPLNRLNIKIEDEAKERLLSQISGHPQLLQHACHILVENTNASNKVITEWNVIQAIDNLINDSANKNLDTLRRDLSRNNELRSLSRDILEGKKRVYHPYKKFSLMGAGAIINKDSYCDIRNEIYRRVIGDVLKNDDAIESIKKEIEKDKESQETKSATSTQSEDSNTIEPEEKKNLFVKISTPLAVATGSIATYINEPDLMKFSAFCAFIALIWTIISLVRKQAGKWKLVCIALILILNIFAAIISVFWVMPPTDKEFKSTSMPIVGEIHFPKYIAFHDKRTVKVILKNKSGKTIPQVKISFPPEDGIIIISRKKSNTGDPKDLGKKERREEEFKLYLEHSTGRDIMVFTLQVESEGKTAILEPYEIKRFKTFCCIKKGAFWIFTGFFVVIIMAIIGGAIKKIFFEDQK